MPDERPTLSLPDFPDVELLPPTVTGQAAWQAFFDRILAAPAAEVELGSTGPLWVAPGEEAA